MKWQAKQKEYWQLSPKEFRAFLASIIFLILGFLTILIFKGLFKVQQDAVLIAFLLVPVLIYLILAGKLLEINAGGVSAKFNDVAQKPLFEKDGINIPIEIEPVVANQKERSIDLPALLDGIYGNNKNDIANSRKSLVLTVRFRQFYVNKVLLRYLQGLSQFRKFLFLVILREDNEIFGYIEAWRALQIIQLQVNEKPEEGEEIEYDLNRSDRENPVNFAQAVNCGMTEELTKYGIIKETARPTDKTLDVLETMTRLNIDAILVADEERKLKGVVERKQIL